METLYLPLKRLKKMTEALSYFIICIILKEVALNNQSCKNDTTTLKKKIYHKVKSSLKSICKMTWSISDSKLFSKNKCLKTKN